MSLPQGQSVHISGITLSLQQQSGKIIDRITLKCEAGNEQLPRQISVQILPGGEYKEQFEPPLELSARDRLSVSVKYRSRWLREHTIDVNLGEAVTKVEHHRDGKQVYSKSSRNVTVAVNISPLNSDTSQNPNPSIIPPDNPVIISPPTATISKTRPLNSATGKIPSTSIATTDETLSQSTSVARKSPHTSSTAASESPPPLTSITSEIIRVCPQFRLLIIGNTGVGKSTLVQKVFGVENVDVSESSRGGADIDKEFVSAENKLFVVHDSLGFEAGESKNMDTVLRFIGERREKTVLKDKLHAIWVCISVPYAGGRVLEAGVENFLQKRKSILVDIPVVVVITKLDLLDASLLQQERKQFKSLDEMQTFLNGRRSAFLEKYISEPLRRAMGNDLRYVAVSTRSGFKLEPTIPELVKTTISEINRHIGAGTSTAIRNPPNIERSATGMVAEMAMKHGAQFLVAGIAGMAQRTSVVEKVRLTIEVAKKEYRKNINTSNSFWSYKMLDCVSLIHEDIVEAWNFDCTEGALKHENFPEALWDTSYLDVQGVPKPLDIIIKPFRMFISELVTDPLVAVKNPIKLVGGFQKLAEGVQNSNRNARKFLMAYTVDLVYVMQLLFVFSIAGVTPENINRVFSLYDQTYRKEIRKLIAEFDESLEEGLGVEETDLVVKKMEELIQLHPISDEDVPFARDRIREVLNLDKQAVVSH